MKIINGGKKDYYDYLSGIYGIDEDIVYDRRDGYVFRKLNAGEQYFIKEKNWQDKPKQEIRGMHYEGDKYLYGTYYRGLDFMIVIEVGFIHYLFHIERFLDENDKVEMNIRLVWKKQVTEKKSKAPIAVIPVEYYQFYRDKEPRIQKYRMDQEIQNPIFENTWVPSFIPADEIYNNVYDYLIKMREPNIVDNRNDVQKLESKGFDKKSSFRNPVNNANTKKK